MRGADEHEIARAPGVEGAVREDSRHPEPRHLGDVVPAEHLPFVRQDRVEPRVVRPVADGVVVEERDRLVEVVQQRGLRFEEGREDVSGQFEGQPHGVAVVVVGDVLAPVDEGRPVLLRVSEVPVVDVHLPVAAVHFDDGRDQGDDVVPDELNVRALVHGEAIGELHERGGGPGLGGVNRAGDVVDRDGLSGDPLRLRVVHPDRAGVGELREAPPVLLHRREERLRGNRDDDHLAPLLRRADRADLHPRRGRFEHPHVAVHFRGIGELARRARHVPQDGLRRRDALRQRQVIHEGRQKESLRRVFPDLLRVLLVDLLGRIARRPRLVHGREQRDGRARMRKERQGIVS